MPSPSPQPPHGSGSPNPSQQPPQNQLLEAVKLIGSLLALVAAAMTRPWAAVVVGIGILLSATINPLFGRFVHWDWMAGVAPTGFAALTLAFRKRWV